MSTNFSDRILGRDTHANRPAAASVPEGTVYSCSDHSIAYKAVAGAWTDWLVLGAAPPAGSGYTAAIQAEPDLVHYWPINEARGSTSFADTEGGAALAAPSGSVYGTGAPLTGDIPGGSAPIGSTWLRRTTIANIFKNATPWTLEWWMIGIGTTDGDSGIIGQWNGSHGPQIFFSSLTDFRIYYGGSNKTTTITAAQWQGLHHWALTWDTTALKLYHDGADLGLTGMPTGTASDSGVPFEIGRYNNGAGAGAQRFVVSDVAIYNDDLSAAEVLAHYALGT